MICIFKYDVKMNCRAFTVSRPLATVSVRSRSVKVFASNAINPDIKKDNPKVVDIADVSQQEKPQVAYCRCWRSKTFPLCDGM